MDFQTIQAIDIKRVIDHGADATRHDPAPLGAFSKPIADFRLARAPVDVQMSNAAEELAVFKNAALKAVLTRKALEAAADKAFGVLGALGVIHPWQPLARVSAVVDYQRVQVVDMYIFEDA